MKYFIYVSDTKVDMLYGQIPRSLKDKIAGELKVDLHLVSASIKERDAEETRYSKLSVVTDYIDKHCEVGTIDYPGSYFKGTLDMNWGNVGGEGSSERIIFFVGSTERSILGLGGSPWHVLGNVRPTSPTDINSSGAYLLHALSKDLALQDPALEKWASEKIGGTSEEYVESRALGMVVSAWRALTFNFSDPNLVPGDKAPQFPKQRLEFLAKRILHGGRPERTADASYHPSQDRFVLLGSPIYVSQAD
jgi:hypothetical protein